MSAALKQALARADADGWREWVRGPADEHAILTGHYFDVEDALYVRAFFEEYLCIAKGVPFTLLDWQWRDVVGPLFGWKRPDGLRRFTRGYLSCAKKNGKTILMSGIALYMLLADGEPAAECYSAAADREQAALTYKEMAKLVEASPAIARACDLKNSTKTVVGKGRSFYRAMSGESGNKDGPNIHLLVFEELHSQPDRELWDKLKYAGAARRQPLMIAVTTAGDGNNAESICMEQYTYAKGVIAGEIQDPTFFAQIYEAGPNDDWQSEDTWRKANPSYGTVLKPEGFRADLNESKDSPAKENTFRRYRLNQWVATASAWLSPDLWTAAKGDVDPEALKGRECYAGLDPSAVDDTTAAVLLFPDDDGGITLVSRFWLPADNIHRLEKRHRVPYRAWAKAGHMTLTPGNVVDYAKVRRDLNDLASDYRIKQISIDRKFQGQQLELDLIADGFDVVPAGQGYVSQDLPAKELEKLLKAGLLRHGGHPVLAWHASNVVVDIDKAGNYAINKKRSRSKIDGIAASLMAIFCKMNDRSGTTSPAFYESNPVIVLEMA